VIDESYTRVATTRSVNERILEIAGSFDLVGPVPTYQFVCVCGCLGQVGATLSEYDRADGGLLLPNHTPPT